MRITSHDIKQCGCRVIMMAITVLASGLLLTGVAGASSLTFQPGIGGSNSKNTSTDSQHNGAQRLLGQLRVDSMFETADDLECPTDVDAMVWAPALQISMGQLGTGHIRSERDARMNGTMPGMQGVSASAITRPDFQAGRGSASGGGGGGGGGGSDPSAEETAPFEYDVAERNEERNNSTSSRTPARSTNERHAGEASSVQSTAAHDRRSRSRSDHVVIPFPPAVWMGLIGLGIVVIVRGRGMLGV